MYAISQHMRQSFYSVLSSQGLPAKEVAAVWQAFTNALQKEYSDAIAAAQAKATPATQYQLDLRIDPKILTQQLQAFDDAQKVFGTNNGDMQRVLTGYAALLTEASNPKNKGNDQLLQQVSQAQTNYLNSVTKNVQDALRSSSQQTTFSGQIGDLTAALSQIANARSQITKMMERFKNVPAVLKGLEQLMGLVADQARQTQQQILQVMQVQAQEATSSIVGLSPETGIQRDQLDIAKTTEQLGYAQRNHLDASTVGTIQTRLNQAQQTLLKDQADNARSIVEAQGKLAESSVTGITPQDDIRRAQLAIESARNTLAIDKSQGRGESQIIQDQAALYDAERTLNQQIQQRDAQIRQDAASLIQAQAQLAENQTLDPVAQAQIQLRADIAALSTIKPQDYKSQTEYQTALTQAQAKIAKDRQDVTQQYIDVQSRSLQFELHTQQISDQQYIDGLQNLLKIKKMSLATRQQLLTEIYDTEHSTAVNLNVGDIRLPTSYEVRRAIQAAAHSAAQGRIPSGGTAVVQNNTTTNHVAITLNVARAADVRRVADVFDKALKSNFTGAAQAAGMI